MPSTERFARRPWRSAQSGQSIVEPLVASMILGIAIVAGLAALDSAQLGAKQAVHRGWGDCVARGEMQAIQASAYSVDGTGYPHPQYVEALKIVTAGAGSAQLQRITVQVDDPDSHAPLLPSGGIVFYRAAALDTGVAVSPAKILDPCRPLLPSS
ncbi:MAG: hypothetical protein M3024_01235 [Candidatus Dormibacteraeota bacterium]|nr:hypothetical protein [Candidatus Dormibacteraeota bacterium]